MNRSRRTGMGHALTPSMNRLGLALVVALGLACTSQVDDAPLDSELGCETCGGKADEHGLPDEGTCRADALVRVANEASFEALDDDAALNRRAAQNIVDARAETPFERIEDVDMVSWVGAYTLGQILEYAELTGVVEEECAEDPIEPELGVVSDLDKTVIPPEGDLELPDAPYPGVTTLYAILEHGSDGTGEAGDFTYVTARTPDRVEDVPAWLEEKGLPAATIESGVSGIPWIAQEEKVNDITRVFEANPQQSFVLFGDTSHRDPEAYKEILARFPDQFRVGLIHMVNMTVSEHRLEGLYLHHNYAEAAAILVGEGVISEQDARRVYEDAVEEGLELSEEEFETLLETYSM